MTKELSSENLAINYLYKYMNDLIKENIHKKLVT